jgi:hypothetical protein
MSDGLRWSLMVLLVWTSSSWAAFVGTDTLSCRLESRGERKSVTLNLRDEQGASEGQCTYGEVNELSMCVRADCERVRCEGLVRLESYWSGEASVRTFLFARRGESFRVLSEFLARPEGAYELTCHYRPNR